jgi:hypothetical protein
MKASSEISRLQTMRRRLLVAYATFVAAFATACTMAASDASHDRVLAMFALAAVVALPLFVLNVLVHAAARAIRPGASTAGLRQLLISITFLTPIEAALVLPAINLVVSSRVLKATRASDHSPSNARAADAVDDNPLRTPA